MAVTVRERKLPSGDTHFQADIRVRLSNGKLHRERVKAPGRTRAAALRWARQREAHLVRHGLEKKEDGRSRLIPTFSEFAPRFIRDHVRANRLSPTTEREYALTIKNHLVPVFGSLRLDEIEPSHVHKLKQRRLAASTINKTLRQLAAIVHAAERWGVIEKGSLTFKKVKQPLRHPKFYDFGQYRQLTQAARPNVELHAAVRLGGDAGLRRGEILGLRWANVHFDRHKLLVCDNLVRSVRDPSPLVIRAPKGGRPRWVPMSEPLEKALRALEQRGEHVLTGPKGQYLTPTWLAKRLAVAQRRAGVARSGPHILRHTFCSHLVLRGVHVRTIQKLAGHAKLSTTEVYMHLVAELEEDAIRRLREDERDE